MKKITLLIITFLFFVFTQINAEIIESGTCGNNLSWELYSDSTLIIDGNGDMDSYYLIMQDNYYIKSRAPWFGNRLTVKKVIIESGVTSIGNGAFTCCSNLEAITIPEGIQSIGLAAFAECIKLNTINIPASVHNIEMNAFSNTEWWKNIPEGLCYINNMLYCYKGNMPEKSNITIKEGVKTICDYAFENCINLISITIPSSVEVIGPHSFYTCENLEKIIVDENNKNYITKDNILYNKDLTQLIICPEGITKVNIPFGITAIDQYSFRNCKKISYINIPRSVQSIGSYTFNNSLHLIDTIICNVSNECIIYEGPVDEWEEHNNELHPFFNMTTLKYLVAPAKIFNFVKEDIIENYSNQLTYICISDGALDENGFNYINRSKKSLQTIDLAGATNTTINDLAFYDCYKLENLMLPKNVENIGFKAFADCVNLKAIKFPSTLKVIQDLSFENCIKIDTIQVDAIVPPIITSTSFDKVSRDIEFIVPEEARNAYAEDEYWKEFIQEDLVNVENVFENINIYTKNSVLHLDGLSVDYQVYDVNGRLVYSGRDAMLSLPRGVYVVAIGGEVEKVVI